MLLAGSKRSREAGLSRQALVTQRVSKLTPHLPTLTWRRFHLLRAIPQSMDIPGAKCWGYSMMTGEEGRRLEALGLQEACSCWSLWLLDSFWTYLLKSVFPTEAGEAEDLRPLIHGWRVYCRWEWGCGQKAWWEGLFFLNILFIQFLIGNSFILFKHHEDSEKSVSHVLFPSFQFLVVMLTFALREIYFIVKVSVFNSHFKECSFLKKLKVVLILYFNFLETTSMMNYINIILNIRSSFYHYSLMHCWIPFTNILFRIFTLTSVRDIDLWEFFVDTLSSFGINIMLIILKQFGNVPLIVLSWDSLSSITIIFLFWVW